MPFGFLLPVATTHVGASLASNPLGLNLPVRNCLLGLCWATSLMLMSTEGCGTAPRIVNPHPVLLGSTFIFFVPASLAFLSDKIGHNMLLAY